LELSTADCILPLYNKLKCYNYNILGVTVLHLTSDVSHLRGNPNSRC